ncbi:MAG: LLM class flavin-dependent oxidoreductase [Actinomycetota bacterium]
MGLPREGDGGTGMMAFGVCLAPDPAPRQRMEWGARLIRDLVAGKEVDYEGTPLHLKWARWDLPVWLAAYGPKALQAVGRVADGPVMRLADPFIP